MTITGKDIHAAFCKAVSDEEMGLGLPLAEWEEVSERARGLYDIMAASLNAVAQAPAAVVAYTLDVERTAFYYHPECLSQLEARNLNGLTPGEIARDRATLHPLSSAEVPPGAVCCVPWCKKPISETPQASER